MEEHLKLQLSFKNQIRLLDGAKLLWSKRMRNSRSTYISASELKKQISYANQTNDGPVTFDHAPHKIRVVNENKLFAFVKLHGPLDEI